MGEVAVRQDNTALLERVVIGGDLSKLNPQERMIYYADVCRSTGLNPLTRPFEYITLNNKLTLYAKRDATDQLRALKGISIQIVGRELLGEIYVVTARASAKSREDESTGAVSITGLKGADLANAYMKAETKAKRRVTLSIAGLGMLDESEVGDIDPTTAAPGDRPVVQMPKAIEKKPEAKPEVERQSLASTPGVVNQTQTKILRKKLEKSGRSETDFCEHFGIPSIEQLPMAQVNDALQWSEASK